MNTLTRLVTTVCALNLCNQVTHFIHIRLFSVLYVPSHAMVPCLDAGVEFEVVVGVGVEYAVEHQRKPCPDGTVTCTLCMYIPSSTILKQSLNISGLGNGLHTVICF